MSTSNTRIAKCDSKEKRERWIDDYLANENKRQEIIAKMTSNTDYIEWLKQFTLDKDAFFDDSWLYLPQKIKDSDRKNVEKFYLLYEGISKYAEKNYIYPTSCDFGSFYTIKYNELFFDIGVLVRQETVCFFRKRLGEQKKPFIDFSDVINNKKQEKVDEIDTMLNILKSAILEAYETGVPMEAMKTLFAETDDKIRKLERK